MTASTSSMAASSVRISNLHKSYGKVQVLKGIDMQVEPGEVVCLIGPSGSGKSTLLRCVNLLEEPNDGTIMVGDTEVTDPDVDINRVRTHMGMVFQQFNLFGHLNILDNCTIAQIKVLGRSKAEAEAVAREQLAKVGLEGKEDRFPAQLSGGQQQRVACARAIMARPSVIFADEPTGNLDSRSSREVLSFLRDSVRDYGQSIVMVTHDPRAASFADRVLVLADGNITRDMQHPTYDEILEVFAGNDDDADNIDSVTATEVAQA